MDYVARYGEWALVLGGSEGLGRAIAHELAARGMNLVLAARREGPLRDAADAIVAQHGVETRILPIDLAGEDVIARIEAGMAGADPAFIVYNAAAEPYGDFLELGMDDHAFNIAVNIVAPTRIAHHFGRQMVARGKGGIVLCASLASAQGLYKWVGYSAAKAYDHILGEGLWYELGLHGVDACTLMIGTTWTESFQRTQKKLGGIFSESREPANLPPGFALPQLPEEAAANLFAQIDAQWLPLVYANPADEERSKLRAGVPRQDLIRGAAQFQTEWYSRSANIG